MLLVLVAGFVSLGRAPVRRSEVGAPVVAVSALALWYLVASVLAHDVRAGAPAVELLVTIAAVLIVVPRASAADRRLLLWGVLLVGLVVAGSGWIGFVARHPPLAIPDTCCGGIWRAASTITYANGASAFLAGCVLVAVSLLVRAPSPTVLRLVLYVLLVGFLATFSRGGVVGLLAGAVVLVAVERARALLFERAVAPVLGALLATAALLPSLPLRAHHHIALEVAGLLLGAVVSAMPSVRIVVALAAALVLVCVASSGVRRPVVDGWRTVQHGRVTATSPDRSRAMDAALRLARRHPVVGVGPGKVDLTWQSTDPVEPGELHLRYAHNEYVQVLVEAGGIGAAILAAGIVAIGIALWRRRHILATAAGCLGAVVALAVHSATDYLWHIPLIPLTGAVLVGALLPGPTPARVRSGADAE